MQSSSARELNVRLFRLLRMIGPQLLVQVFAVIHSVQQSCPTWFYVALLYCGLYLTLRHAYARCIIHFLEE